MNTQLCLNRMITESCLEHRYLVSNIKFYTIIIYNSNSLPPSHMEVCVQYSASIHGWLNHLMTRKQRVQFIFSSTLYWNDNQIQINFHNQVIRNTTISNVENKQLWNGNTKRFNLTVYSVLFKIVQTMPNIKTSFNEVTE